MKHYNQMAPGGTPYKDRLEIHSPYDLSLIATADLADAATVETALVTADRLYQDRSTHLSTHARLQTLETTAQIMSEQFESLAYEAAREGGKPLLDSQVEVTRAIDGIKLCIETIRTNGGKEIPMGINQASAGKIAFTRHEPIGVVVAISAFNHPLNLIVHQVAPAIATGCPVIVKPAKKTPISCFRFVQILQEAGLPDGWCQAIIPHDHALNTRLSTDPRVSFLSFIGSGKTGWMLRSKLAPGTRCALEHGGVAPVIVAEDADISAAIPKLVKGGLYHAGQVCVSVQKIFVQESIVQEMADKIATAAQKLCVGNPTDKKTEVGPLIDPSEVTRVHDWVCEAVENGAELLTGGKPISPTCYECTILLNPPEQVNISRLEIFGPVICIYSYSNIEEAIGRANQLPFSFQAAVFTQSIDTAMQAYDQINASAVMVNEHTAFRVDWMPFAGQKESGMGTGGIPYTIEDMQQEKMLIIHSEALKI